MESVRLSLDLSMGTFTKVEAICKSDFRSKADYLRMLIEKDFAERDKHEARK